MIHNKELSEDLKLRIVKVHETGKGHKMISESLNVPARQSTVRQIVDKWIMVKYCGCSSGERPSCRNDARG